MKMVIAYIQPVRLPTLLNLLRRAEVTVLSVADVQGMGRRRTGIYRGVEYAADFAPEVRLEIVAEDDDVDMVIQTILAGLKGQEEESPGDGKVFVLPIECALRIRPDGRALAI
jgi:nitrogen regulatory protein P-II 1